MSSFAYHRPRTMKEALALAQELPDARYIAGGTDILVKMRKRAMAAPPALISLRNIPELRAIDAGAEEIRIGAGVALWDVERHSAIRELFPALIDSIAVLGSRQIREVATLAGNLCNASPGADTAPPLLVYDARVAVESAAGRREIAMDEFFKGPGKTALEPGEIVTAVILPAPPRGSRAAFLRRARIKMDIATVILAMRLSLDGNTCTAARVAAGAVAPVPLRLRKAEQKLVGSELGDDVLGAARALAMEEVAPITDVRSTAEYRRHLIGVYFLRAANAIISQSPSSEEQKR